MPDMEKPVSPPATAAPAAPAPASPAASAVPTAAAGPTAAAAAKPAAPAAKPAAKPAPKKDEASPNAVRPAVLIAGIAGLAIEDIVVPFTYTTRDGDTLASLAKDFYGSRAKAALIRAANPTLTPGEGPLASGLKVKIPKA